jgi:hypothetical protein
MELGILIASDLLIVSNDHQTIDRYLCEMCSKFAVPSPLLSLSHHLDLG